MSDAPKKLPTRSCRYCKAKFKPIRADQRFCKPAHRKSFWKYGGLPYDKMKEQIMKDVRKLLCESQAEALARFDNLWEQIQTLCSNPSPDARDKYAQALTRFKDGFASEPWPGDRRR